MNTTIDTPNTIHNFLLGMGLEPGECAALPRVVFSEDEQEMAVHAPDGSVHRATHQPGKEYFFYWQDGTPASVETIHRIVGAA